MSILGFVCGLLSPVKKSSPIRFGLNMLVEQNLHIGPEKLYGLKDSPI